MKRHLISAALLGLLASAAAAMAAPPPPPPPPGGPDGPGELFISPDGAPFRGGGGREAWFARADADHDGALTPPEFRADAALFFKVLDANGDGAIDGAENQVYERQVAPEITRMSFDRAGPGGGPGGGGGPPGKGGRRGGGKGAAPIGREGAARFGLLNEPQPVRGADANLDYRVTADEWARAATRRFGLLDVDGDGRLTLQTLPGQHPGGAGRPHRIF